MRYTTEIAEKHRTSRHFDFGKKFGHFLKPVLPDPVCRLAAATCRFQIMGKNAHADNGVALRSENSPSWIGEGRWICTQIQTVGNRPSDSFKRNGPRSEWVTGHSFEAADDILGCFALTMQDVIDALGQVDEGQRIVIDLVDIYDLFKTQIDHLKCD